MLLREAFPVAVAAAFSLTARLGAQEPVPAPARPVRPIQVTDSAIARGREIFHGTGNCAACHGPAGAGTDSGPPLAQGVWLHGPDSYEGILERVVHGVPRSFSTRDIAMPMRGWNDLSNAQVRDVAAYVWFISHSWQRPIRPRKPS
jgi:mono/diheme cytochrome c family protein